MQYPNKTFCLIQCHLFELFFCALYVWHLVFLGLFYHVSHAPPWRISSQYDSLTSTAWKPSCSLCQQKPDVSWTPLCIFSMAVIDCKGRWQALWSKWNHLTSPGIDQCKNRVSMHPWNVWKWGHNIWKNHQRELLISKDNYLHCMKSLLIIVLLQFEAAQVDSCSWLWSKCSQCSKL